MTTFLTWVALPVVVLIFAIVFGMWTAIIVDLIRKVFGR